MYRVVIKVEKTDKDPRECRNKTEITLSDVTPKDFIDFKISGSQEKISGIFNDNFVAILNFLTERVPNFRFLFILSLVSDIESKILISETHQFIIVQ